jgi:hypothetical protein
MQRLYRVTGFLEGANLLTYCEIPEFDNVTPAASGESLSIWANRDRFYRLQQNTSIAIAEQFL